MTQARVILVGYEDQDNLGLRYLSSCLRARGHWTRIVSVRGRAGSLLEAVRAERPHVVGFSLIFQYLVPEFASLLAEMRNAGVSAHFTVGGHYASFEPQTLMRAIPELDSVVRFEGEDTLVELVERVAGGEPWHSVAGTAARTADGVVLNPIRPGRAELDNLPWPDRDDIQYEHQGLPTASVIGGRGCPWKCTFCSIITFYEGNGTRGRRRRQPKRIVDELEYLHRKRGVRIILWQDDDFLAGGRIAVAWAHEIARECVQRRLHQTIRWKISCRSDEVKEDTLAPLVEAGLTHVYLGVESGDPDNLRHMNKLLGPEAHLRAREVLQRLGLSFDFGFMLFEPWSTLATVRNNIAFLRDFAGDGSSIVSFCRTLPYAGTPIETRLRIEGRLLKNDFTADYCFLDSRLDVLYDWTLSAFGERNFSVHGTANLLRLLLFELNLRLPDRWLGNGLRDCGRALAAVSNRLLLDALEGALDYVESAADPRKDDSALQLLAAQHAAEDASLRQDLARLTARRTRARSEQLLHATR